MADVKISGMTAATALTGAEVLPVVQSSANVKATTQQVVDAAMTTGLTRQALGSINTNTTIDWSAGSYVTATIGGALTFTFSNPAPTGKACVAYLQLTNGGSAVITWPVSVTWSGGTAPTLRASGVDLLRFYTQDNGTTWFGTAEIDEQQFAASAITSGTVATVRLGSGTADSTTFLRGDQTWATPSGGSPGGSSGQFQFNDASSFGGASLWREDANTIAQRNSTTTQVAYFYKTYTDSSNYERFAIIPGAASGWMQISAQSAGSGTANIGVALTPKGTGALSAQVPDSGTGGGNARGANAVDWQTLRNAATQVASGLGSAVLGGQRNTASDAYAVVAGGSNNTASGSTSVVSGGATNTASGSSSWVPGGVLATTRGLIGAYAYSAGARSTHGDAQVIGQPVRRTTTDATPVSLATDGTPAAATVMVLPANSTLMVTAIVCARSSGGDSAGWIAQALFKRDGSNNTTRLGTATVTAIGTPDAAINTATIDLVANDTLESAQIQVTGVAATTIYWVGELKCIQVA